MKTKKIMKAVALVMVAACMLFVVPNKMTVKAEDTSTTYSVKFHDGYNQWRIQPQYPWVDGGYCRELYYLKDVKDGDKLVIYDSPKNLEINMTQNLANVTLYNTNQAVIYAGSIDEVYVLSGSVAAINAEVGKAYVYNNSKVNFNKNVDYLEIIHESPSSTSVTVLGTVGKDVVKNYDKVVHTGYSFVPGGFVFSDGGMYFKAGSHVLTPPAETPAPATPATPATPSDEYDHVPKTGETTNYIWLVGIAAIALLGASVVAKKVK